MTEVEPDIVVDNIVVGLDYTLTVDGQVIETTAGYAPLEYLQGHHNILDGLERALAGLASGQSKQIFLPANEAYGPINPQAFAEVERDQFPPQFDFKLGRRIRVQDDEGKVHLATICAIQENAVRLDLNHPLAGKNLLFQATIINLRMPTPEELSQGRIGGCASCGSSDTCGGDCQ